MLGFFAAVFSAVWIQEHLPLMLLIVAGVVVLCAALLHRSRARRQAYLALPVQFIGNKATKTFHAGDCPQLSKTIPENRIAFRLPEETARLGYCPCGVCKPRWPSNN